MNHDNKLNQSMSTMASMLEKQESDAGCEFSDGVFHHSTNGFCPMLIACLQSSTLSSHTVPHVHTPSTTAYLPPTALLEVSPLHTYQNIGCSAEEACSPHPFLAVLSVFFSFNGWVVDLNESPL